jgi:Rho termination factor, N-terminal domain
VNAQSKAELDSKHLSELHALAAEAGVPRYRMLRREELVEKLLDGKPARQEKKQPPAPPAESSRPARRRRRRRFGRRGKGLRPHDLLLPPPGRQALVYGESRAACTALLRELAAELGAAAKGPDPIALLVDPSPEELAEWKREAPEAEIVAAGKARHAVDALGQAIRRAEGGEDVILLVDSLTKLEDVDTAKEIFDGGLNLGSAQGSLTVVAALERQS